MSKGYISLLGTSDPLDPADYPKMTDCGSENVSTIGDGKLLYTLGRDKTSEKDAKALNWDIQDNSEMMNGICHFKMTYDTLNDLVDVNPMERVPKVYFEDKLFEA
ncbi:hypothetical protein BGZ47_011333 [Haplosporangium gracile]|nr:hypothetical protein BGZ47_011333 [Haplosporangium gracile]